MNFVVGNTYRVRYHWKHGSEAQVKARDFICRFEGDDEEDVNFSKWVIITPKRHREDTELIKINDKLSSPIDERFDEFVFSISEKDDSEQTFLGYVKEYTGLTKPDGTFYYYRTGVQIG